MDAYAMHLHSIGIHSITVQGSPEPTRIIKGVRFFVYKGY